MKTDERMRDAPAQGQRLNLVRFNRLVGTRNETSGSSEVFKCAVK